MSTCMQVSLGSSVPQPENYPASITVLELSWQNGDQSTKEFLSQSRPLPFWTCGRENSVLHCIVFSLIISLLYWSPCCMLFFGWFFGFFRGSKQRSEVLRWFLCFGTFLGKATKSKRAHAAPKILIPCRISLGTCYLARRTVSCWICYLFARWYCTEPLQRCIARRIMKDSLPASVQSILTQLQRTGTNAAK